MQLEILKEYGKDWIFDDGKVKLIGKYKKQFENGEVTPLLISGHRLYNFLNKNKRFFPAALAQMEMFRLIKQIHHPDDDINMQTGQIGEAEIVKYLNKEYDDTLGTTFPFTRENKGNVFHTTISDIFSALPDYLTAGKHAVFDDKRKRMRKIHEIKTSQKNKWKRDEFKNYMLEVVDDSITEDNIVDNPNPDALKQLFNSLTKEEQDSFSPEEKQLIKEYIKDAKSSTLSKSWWVSYIKRYGIKKWMLEGDLEHNLKPIIQHPETIKVKPFVDVQNNYLKKWKHADLWWAPDDYYYQVCSYAFQYNMDHKNIKNPADVKGHYESEISVLFLDDDQMIIPEDHWWRKFNYIYKNPKPIKITKNNFVRIPVPIDLHKFYETVIGPCINIFNKTIKNQETQEVDFVTWAILKKAFKQNGYDLDYENGITKLEYCPRVNTIKNTIEEYVEEKKAAEEEESETKKFWNSVKGNRK